jgi:LEA14-like dessication related protein
MEQPRAPEIKAALAIVSAPRAAYNDAMRRTMIACAALLAALPLAAATLTPTATLTKFDVKAISLRDCTFLFELTVKNPYPVALSFDGMTLVFSVQGTKVFTATSQGGFTVPASASKANTFTVTIAYEDIVKVVKDYASHDYLDTTIKGTLDIPLPRLPGLPKSWSFTYNVAKKIPAIKPELSVLDFTVLPPTEAQVKDALVKAGKKVDAGKALGVLKNALEGKKIASPVIDPADIDVPISVSFTIQLANTARAELSFAKLGYQLFVNGDKLVTGESTSVVRKAGVSRITVTNTFSSKSLSENVRRLLNERKGTFKLIGTAAVQLPAEIRKAPLPLGFTESGAFSMK